MVELEIRKRLEDIRSSISAILGFLDRFPGVSLSNISRH